LELTILVGIFQMLLLGCYINQKVLTKIKEEPNVLFILKQAELQRRIFSFLIFNC